MTTYEAIVGIFIVIMGILIVFGLVHDMTTYEVIMGIFIVIMGMLIVFGLVLAST